MVLEEILPDWRPVTDKDQEMFPGPNFPSVYRLNLNKNNLVIVFLVFETQFTIFILAQIYFLQMWLVHNALALNFTTKCHSNLFLEQDSKARKKRWFWSIDF